MRLDRYLANNGFGSRSEVKKLISAGRIRVDGKVIKDSGYNVSEGCVIETTVKNHSATTRIKNHSDATTIKNHSGTTTIKNHSDATTIKNHSNTTPDEPDTEGVINKTEVRSGYSYYMLNKPAGVITAAYDALCRTVMDLFDDPQRKGLNPVGRLDKDTEGLLLITDDGVLNHFLTSPKRNVPKIYYAELRGIPDENGIERLRQGVEFKDFTSRPASLEIVDADRTADKSTVLITVTEGRFHEVKRLALTIGCEVKYLKRIGFAGLELDERLKPGEYRKLTTEEINILKKAI